jgi:signal transduction histidine kinase
VALDTLGRIWALTGDTLLREDRDRAWVRLTPAGLALEDILALSPARGGAVFALTDRSLFRIDGPGETATLVAPVPGSFSAREREDGSVVFLANRNRNTNDGGTVFIARDGTATPIYSDAHRVIDLAPVGPDLFVSYDHRLLRIGAEGRVETVESNEGASCCGSILADREGSLWAATIKGLQHYPSPESSSVRPGSLFCSLEGSALWFSTWHGAGRVERSPEGLSVRMDLGPFSIAVCPDPAGGVWSVSRQARSHLRIGKDPETYPGPGFGGYFHGCAQGAQKRVWIASWQGILVADDSNPLPHPIAARIPELESPIEPAAAIFEHSNGTLFFASYDSLCHAGVRAALTEPDPAWSCARIPGSQGTVGFVETSSGSVWAAVRGAGILRWLGPADDRWETVPASLRLRTGTLGRLHRSPRGGIWVLGEGDLIRVAENPAEPEGWDLLERIGPGQGLIPGEALLDLAESASGELWLTTSAGHVVFIPPSARVARESAPAILLVEVSQDGVAVAPETALSLPNDRNRLELRFAVPVFRDPEAVRTRYRLHDGDEWSPPETDSFLRFAGLGQGHYQVSVQASLDGESWSPDAARYEFSVRPPWYFEWWFLVTAAGAAATAAYLVHRARLRTVLRLESQRARIARDLHDEIGSGLGTIGLLSGIARRAEGESGKSAEIVSQIGALAGELGTSLRDIVTSLQPGAANLRALYGHLAERGARLCAAGGPAFQAESLESIPATPLSVPVRINVLLIGVEAIHNAVHHSGAGRISLSLRRDSGGAWILEVADDGRGFEPSPSPGGFGLRNMRERAAEIGAAIAWTKPPGGGTCLTLRFDPGTEPRHHLGRHDTPGRSRQI